MHEEITSRTKEAQIKAMNKSYYTAFLPSSKSSINVRTKLEDPNKSRLEDLDRRLDKNLKSLAKVEEVCTSNLDKCRKIYSISRKKMIFKAK